MYDRTWSSVAIVGNIGFRRSAISRGPYAWPPRCQIAYEPPTGARLVCCYYRGVGPLALPADQSDRALTRAAPRVRRKTARCSGFTQASHVRRTVGGHANAPGRRSHLDQRARFHFGHLGASSAAAGPRLVRARKWEQPYDLAGAALAEVQAPTLLIVGGADPDVITLNRRAARQLQVEHELIIVPGATHLFEEAGTLEEVASLARSWFVRHFSARHAAI